ncbi:protein of unknown function [Pararobbsia alpina]
MNREPDLASIGIDTKIMVRDDALNSPSPGIIRRDTDFTHCDTHMSRADVPLTWPVERYEIGYGLLGT